MFYFLALVPAAEIRKPKTEVTNIPEPNVVLDDDERYSSGANAFSGESETHVSGTTVDDEDDLATSSGDGGEKIFVNSL